MLPPFPRFTVLAVALQYESELEQELLQEQKVSVGGREYQVQQVLHTPEYNQAIATLCSDSLERENSTREAKAILLAMFPLRDYTNVSATPFIPSQPVAVPAAASASAPASTPASQAASFAASGGASVRASRASGAASVLAAASGAPSRVYAPVHRSTSYRNFIEGLFREGFSISRIALATGTPNATLQLWMTAFKRREKIVLQQRTLTVIEKWQLRQTLQEKSPEQAGVSRVSPGTGWNNHTLDRYIRCNLRVQMLPERIISLIRLESLKVVIDSTGNLDPVPQPPSQ